MGQKLRLVADAGKSVADVKSANASGSVEAATKDGTLYAFPMSADNGYFLYYNSTLVTPEDAQTWDTLLAAAEKAGKKVVLGAADTFRAAAVEQICIWGERVGVPVVKQQMGSDPASVAFDTLQSAKANGADVVLIDTAGRLHNKVNLMNELKKIKEVMKKVMPEAPDEVMLVLDGSTGQNAFEQAKQFSAVTNISSLAITKLDGTAKGGVVIGISDQLKVPVKYIGLGEGMEDLQLFNKTEFVDSLFKN